MDTIPIVAATVPEKDLRDLVKSLNMPQGQPSIAIRPEEVQQLSIAIIETAANPEVIGAHLSVAINALRSLFQTQDTTCSSLLGRSLWHDGMWLRCFTIFLERSSSAKGKVMKQFLGTLVSLIQGNGHSVKNLISQQALAKVLHNLLRKSSRARVKSSIFALGLITSKELISLDGILDAVQDSRIPGGSPSSTSGRAELVEYVFRMLFSLAQFPELAPAAGQAACIFSRQLRKSPIKERDGASTAELAALWTEPMLESLRVFPESLPRFRSHVFPELFPLNVPDYYNLLTSMNLHTRLSNDMGLGMDKLESCGQADSNVLFTVLQVGKEIGLVLDSDDPGLKVSRLQGDRVEIQVAAFRKLLVARSSSVRLAGFSLITSASATTRPFTIIALQSLKHALPILMAESDPGARGEIVALFQRLVDRLKAVIFNLDKAAKGTHMHKSCAETRQSILMSPLGRQTSTYIQNAHQDFVQWLVHFLYLQLQPGASYQRHVSALRFVMILAKSGLDNGVHELGSRMNASGTPRWSFHISIFTPHLIRTLQDLIMNAFEDVRNFAAALLQMTLKSKPDAIYAKDLPQLGQLIEFLKRAEKKMLSSGRADHADGVSRIYLIIFNSVPPNSGSGNEEPHDWWETKHGIVQYLVEQFENVLSIAQTNISLAIGKFPMHGIISSLKFIFDSNGSYASLNDEPSGQRLLWISFHQRIITALEAVWLCVHDLLCNDAPEGYVPEELEDEISLTTKDILSYSWRALKESSSLIRTMVQNASIASEQRFGVLTVEDLDRLTAICLTALKELRHRGAFSAVAQAFEACCARNLKEGRNDVLVHLYEDTLRSIQDRGSAITRRSAGIPSLMTGILSADPWGFLFTRAIGDLHSLSRLRQNQAVQYGDSLPQVHALNCLKAIFTSGILGPCSERYLVQGFDLAGQCLTSQLWAIRNCGLMLFRALIDRLLCVTETQNWSENAEKKEFSFAYSDYPNLLDIVLKLLEPSEDQLYSPSAAIESVFPALKIIQSIPPPAHALSQIRNSVRRLCGSSHWHVRDMAARSLSILISSNEVVATTRDLLGENDLEQNRIHGRLLCVSHILRRQLILSSNTSQGFFGQVVASLDEAIELLYIGNVCPITQAAFVDLHNVLLQAALKSSHIHHLSEAFSEKLVLAIGSADAADFNSAASFDCPPMLQKSIMLYQLLRGISGVFRDQREFSVEQDRSNPRLDVLIADLAMQDANACSWAFSELEKSLLPPTVLEPLAHSLYNLSRSQLSSDVLGASQRLLIQILESELISFQPTEKTPFIFLKKTFFGGNTQSPSRVESGIRLWSLLLNQTCKRLPWSKELAEEVHCLLQSIRPLLDSSHPFSIRNAAVLALNDLDQVWHLPKSATGSKLLRLKANLLTYDSLNDDDEEIRESAAVIASRALHVSSRAYSPKPILPIVASHRLAWLMSKSFSDNKALCREAIHRTSGARIEDSRQCLSAAQAFGMAIEEHTALFQIEKQNLFIDEVREAALWSAVAKRLSREAVTEKTFKALWLWVRESLELILRHGQGDGDEALGWSSKPEAFVFVARALCGVDVILHWSATMQIPTLNGSDILCILAQLVEAGKQNGLHGILLHQAEKVLERSVKYRLNAVRQRVARLEEETRL